MATTVTTTYAGEFAGKYISAALLSANTIENGGITVKPNISKKEVIKKGAISGIIGAASCDFTSAGDLTLTERILQPEEFQVNLELCKSDFQGDWEASQMGYGLAQTMPPKLSDWILGEVAAQVAQKTEQNIWSGVNANAGEFDGIVTLAAADSDVIDVTGTTVTAANVIEELGKVVDDIPSALYGKEDLKVYVSQNVYRAYVRALGGFASNGLGANGVGGNGTNQSLGDVMFDGVPVFVANGLASNKMVAAQTSNLYFGTGLLSDLNEAKVIDMAEIDGSKNVRVILRFTAGVNYGLGSEIVLYS